MSEIDRWLLPEGIEELLPPQAERIERVRRDMLDLFHSWGYELVMPPLIEYIESLLIGTGNDLDLDTFKLTDQLTGRLMGIRADMTPQVARIDAHRLKRAEPVRLCYLGPVLLTRARELAGSRNPIQVGAELYGHGGIESDVEVLQLMLEALRAAGINQVHLDLGHVGIYRELARQAGLDEALEERLFDALQRKARPELEALLQGVPNADAREMLVSLVELDGDVSVLEKARTCLGKANGAVHAALDNIQQIAELLCRRVPDAKLHFDLAELRGYFYHTGLVFAAYVKGCGQAVAQGGRYDDIGAAFGRARPATGFSMDLRNVTAVNPAAPSDKGAIFSPYAEDPALGEQVRRLRGQGEKVIDELPGQSGGAREMGCDREIVRRGDSWQVVKLEK